jgi:hypothetical protein
LREEGRLLKRWCRGVVYTPSDIDMVFTMLKKARTLGFGESALNGNCGERCSCRRCDVPVQILKLPSGSTSIELGTGWYRTSLCDREVYHMLQPAGGLFRCGFPRILLEGWLYSTTKGYVSRHDFVSGEMEAQLCVFAIMILIRVVRHYPNSWNSRARTDQGHVEEWTCSDVQTEKGSSFLSCLLGDRDLWRWLDG